MLKSTTLWGPSKRKSQMVETGNVWGAWTPFHSGNARAFMKRTNICLWLYTKVFQSNEMFPAGFSFCRKCWIINTFNANKGTKIVHFTSTDLPQDWDLDQLSYKGKKGEPGKVRLSFCIQNQPITRLLLQVGLIVIRVSSNHVLPKPGLYSQAATHWGISLEACRPSFMAHFDTALELMRAFPCVLSTFCLSPERDPPPSSDAHINRDDWGISWYVMNSVCICAHVYACAYEWHKLPLLCECPS